jgi:hypothetical protein
MGSVALVVLASGLIAPDSFVSAQLAEQLEPFGQVQKTITILGPSSPFDNVGHTYVEQGMVLTALSCCASDPTFVSVTDSSSPLYVGENTLFHHIDGGLIMLACVDEGTFNMNSIDVAQLPGFDQFGNPVLYGPFPITFTGIKKNGKTVTTVFTAHNFPQVDTFTFNGFNELVALQWFNGGAPGIPDHQFAKIVVQKKKPLLP